MGKSSRKKRSPSQPEVSTGSPDRSSSHIQPLNAAQNAGGLFSRISVHILLVLLLGFFAYSNTFHSPFQWDDGEYLVKNPFVKDLSFFADPSKAQGMFDNALKSRYVGFLTFALNYRLHDFDVFGYHVVNLLIHLTNAILVYFLILLTFRTPYLRAEGYAPQGNHAGIAQASDYSRFIALAVALLFVVHPVQTEAVTYIFQRFASLVTMFYLLSLVLYIKARLKSQSAESMAHDAENPVHYARGTKSFFRGPAPYALCSLLFAVLAMKTKENAFTLPVIIALYEFLFFSGSLKTRALRLVPYLLTMLIIPAMFIGTGGKAGEVMGQIKDPAAFGFREIPRLDYLLTQFRVIVTYLRLLVLPVNQNIDYDYPVYQTLFALPVLISFLFLSVLFGTGVYLIYKSKKLTSWQADKPAQPRADSPGRTSPQTALYYRLIGFGIIWFFVTISVESSIIPIPMVISEYRMYLPSVGFFLAVVAGISFLLQRFGGDSLPRHMKAAGTITGLIVLALASATYARNSLWKDKVTLWEDVVRKSPNSPRAYDILGVAHYEKGAYDKAIENYKHVIALLPAFRNAHVNLGVAYAATGNVGMAIDEFTIAIAIDPRNSTAYANLGLAYSGMGRFGEAVDNYLKATSLDPYNSKAFHGLGTAYVNLGHLDGALSAYTKFVELSPRDPEAYRNRGNVYAFKGDFRNAGEDFRKACALGSRQSCNNLQDPRFN